MTDGDYVYMRAAAREDNKPSRGMHIDAHEHPWILLSRAASDSAELVGKASRTVGRACKCRSRTYMNSHSFGSSLWDVRDGEERIEDADVEERMIPALVNGMRAVEAPAEEFERLGLTA